MVKIRLLCKCDIGNEGDVVDVDKKGAKAMVDAGDAKYDFEITKEDAIRLNNSIPKRKIKNEKQPRELIEEKTTTIDTKTRLSSEIIEKEAIINGSKPKWLIVKKIRKTDDKIKDILDNEALVEENIEFETQEPNQWQCNKCKATFQSDEKPFYCEACQRETSFKQITDSINLKRWKLTKWKDVDINDIGVQVIFADLVKLIKRCIVFEHELFYEIFALWIIASYKSEAYDSISFLLFQGLIESGKTRGLDLLRELGYRMIHTTGVTFPAMCRYTDKYQAGILVDEIDNKVDSRTEGGRAYLDFLKPSYRRGSVYATAHREDQDETKEYSNYGFKAFAGEHGGTDPALRSRCIIFRMEQAYPDIPDLRYIQDELDAMQNLLLNYRFKCKLPEPLELEFALKGRDRELFSCLIMTAKNIGIDYQHIIDFINKRTEEKIETLRETDEYFILKAIYNITTRAKNSELLFTDDAPEVVRYSEIAAECGWDDDTEMATKKRQHIGYVMKKMQLKTKKQKDGVVFLFNNEYNLARLPNLYNRYYVT